MLALLALELQAKRLFEGAAQRLERRKLRCFDTCTRIAGVRRNEPGDILGVDERRRMQHYALNEFDEAHALLISGFARMTGEFPEILRRCRERVALSHDGCA